MSGLQPRPAVLRLAPYVQGQSAIEGVSEPIKLSSNESSQGPPPPAIEAYQHAAGEPNRYPAGSPQEPADVDLAQWRAEVGRLPGGKSRITRAPVDGVTVHTATVHWNESRNPAVTGLNCPPATATDLRCVQLRL